MAITIGEILGKINDVADELNSRALNSYNDKEVDAYNDASDMVENLLDRIKEQL